MIWKERRGKYIYDGYGRTESVNLVANFRCLPVKPGSMGMPAPGFIVDVLDEGGKPAPVGTEGEIAVKVKPNRLSAYSRNISTIPQQRRISFAANGISINIPEK